MNQENNKEIVKKNKIEEWKKLKDEQFKLQITTYKDTIVLPELNDINNKKTAEKFDIIDIIKTTPETKIINTELNIIFDKLYKDNTDLNDKLKKTLIYYIYPTEEQKKILLYWFDLYIYMYNKVLEKVKQIRKEENKKQNKMVKINELNLDLNLTKLKKEFSDLKKELSNKINPITKEKSKINKHILDYAIKDAISSINSIMTNLKNNHVKNTRLRYLKTTKNTKIIKIEKNICQLNSFCSSVLGKKINIKPDIKFNDITEVAILQYNKKKDTFRFLVKEKVEMKNENKINRKIIAIDPGFRTLITGISNEHIIEIGINPLKKIKPKIIKLEKIKNKKIKNKKRQLMKYEDKITNFIKDMHNKIVKKLTSDYDDILIGNMSTKSIVENEETRKEIKKEANYLKIYQLKERLKNKCIKENKRYKSINEYNTSKCCSNCGNKKINLGSNKTYECVECNKIYDRDINASKNILLKGMINK
jgi:transposase